MRKFIAVALVALLTSTVVPMPAFAAVDETVTVAPSVDCDGEYPSGIVITNPATNTQTFFLQSDVSDATGTPQFGDGGVIEPGESFRVASGGTAVTVEDATYSYSVSQSPQVNGAANPTEPFAEVATGTYVFDCEPAINPDERVDVAAAVDCDGQYPSGIVITNPATNTQTFFLQSDVSDATGTPQFGDGGILAPGESLRVASGGDAVTVEDATYSYAVSQSPRVDGSANPTEPFTQVAAGTYVFDCEPPESLTPSLFVSVDPTRLLDTRVGVGATQAPVGAHGTASLQVTGRAGVPAAGVAAVVVNVTVTAPSASGFLTVYPSGTTEPTASNLNFSAGQTIPNLVTVKVGADGKIKLTNNSAGSAHLIADVAGYYVSGTSAVPGAFVSLDPSRLLDTRVGNGAVKAPVGANSTVAVVVTGRGGVPAAGVSAVVLNVTVTSPASGGFVTVFPSGGGQPTASNLNFTPGQTIPNLVTVKVGANGAVNLTNNSAGTSHMIADIAGYYLAGTPTVPGAFASLPPARLLDTRVGNGAAQAPVGASSVVGLQVAGRAGVPMSQVAAVVVNSTVTAPAATGFITVYPSGTGQPTASNLNFSTGQTIPNLVAVKVGANGKVNLANNSSGPAHLIADVAGYFVGDGDDQSTNALAALQLTHDLPWTSVGSSTTALNALTVAVPGAMTGYDRALFPHWRDATNNGWPAIPTSTCDVRQATLYREGTNVSYDSACTILSGSWLDPYTAATLYAASDVDIDHVVPLAAAWRSGAAGWGAAQRLAFANDMLEVVAVDDATNQSKGDKTPDLWKPPNQLAHCLYAKRWVAIKTKYTLSISTSEKAALEQMLSSCDS